MAPPPAIFTGVGVALVTIFDDEGEIDAPATADHAARLVEAGVRAVLVAGTTGEAMALEPDERSDLLIAVRYAVDGRVPVIAGAGERRPTVPTPFSSTRRRAPPTRSPTSIGCRARSTCRCSPTSRRGSRPTGCRSRR
jgi:hypothetical protein